MSNKIIVILAAAAGFAGGILSRYASPPSVYAQSPTVQREVRAQKFVIVDDGGAARGAFGIETDGTVQIEVTDAKGRLWLYNNRPAKFSWSGSTIEDRPKDLGLLH